MLLGCLNFFVSILNKVSLRVPSLIICMSLFDSKYDNSKYIFVSILNKVSLPRLFASHYLIQKHDDGKYIIISFTDIINIFRVEFILFE